MDRIANPFAPGAGTQPPQLAGREEVIDDALVALERIRQRRPARLQVLVGLRGVGKTVLLNRVREMAEARSFEAILTEVNEESTLSALLFPALRKILFGLDAGQDLSEKTKRASEQGRSRRSLG